MSFVLTLLMLFGIVWLVLDIVHQSDVVFLILSGLQALLLLGLLSESLLWKVPERWRSQRDRVRALFVIAFVMFFGIKYLSIFSSISLMEVIASVLLIIVPPILFFVRLKSPFAGMLVLGIFLLYLGSSFILTNTNTSEVWKGLTLYLIGTYALIWNFKRSARDQNIV